MKIALFFISVFTFSVSFSQFTSTPCGAGPLPNTCANNTVNLTSAFTNSGVTNPSVENGVGCNSVGSNITAGTIGGSGGSQAYDGWFTTTADAAGVVDVYAAIVSGDPVVGIYSGPCTALTLITCDDDGGTGLDANATATGLTPGATYWVRVWDYAGGTGTYEITSNNGTPPANDNCAGAQGLTLNGAQVGGTNYCSTVETSDWNDCENNTENNVWYSFTTTADGDITVNFGSIDCFGSGQGIDVTVFYGNCSSFASYGCTSVNAGSTGSIPQFYGPAGTYYVMVDGNNSGGTTALCTFNVDVDFVGCPANAGTNTSPALITVCAGTDYNPTATGTTNTNIGADPCIGWGFWVAADPLNQFPGMTGIGNLPTGNNPAGSGGDPNYAGVFTSTTHPLANGETPTLPWEGNGVTYYIAPITLSNCATGEITTNCFDIGNVTQVYQNPSINTNFIIDCFNPGAPSTYVAIAAAGGAPIVDGSSFTVVNTGGVGTLDISGGTGNNVTFYVDNVPDGGTVIVTITDNAGCSETLTIGPINAAAYCPACGANVGDVNTVQTGSGVTQSNNGINGSPFVLCFGDDLDLSHITSSATLPPDINLCGNSPTDFTVAGSCNPGIVYGIFTGLSTFANPFDDPINFSGFGFATDDINFLNNGFWIQTLIDNGILVVNNTFWLYPVTAQITGIDLNGDGNLNWSEDPFGDGCLDSGSPIAITMLNQIVGTTTNLCDGPGITITGGNPEFFGGNYLVANNAGGTITGLPVTHDGSITITGLNDGDPYNIDITDNNGCTINVSGIYNYTQPVLSINDFDLVSEFCLNDDAVDFDVTPTPLTVTTGSFDIDFVSDGLTAELSWILQDNLGNTVGSGGPYGGYGVGVSLPTEVVSGLNPANGPFILILNDSWGDGQDATGVVGGGIGTTTVINNITGNTVAFTSGNWGFTTTLNLGNFVSTTVTIGGTDVVDNGDGTAVFTPSTVGTHTIGFIYDNGEGCTYTASQVVTVHPNPLLSSVVNPTICANETILLSNFTPGEAFGVPGTGTWYVGNNSAGALAPTTAFTPVNGATYFYEYVATAGGCRDGEVLTVTVNPLPATPTITSTAPTCIADGSSTISNYNAAFTYTFNPTGPTVGAGGAISGMTVGTSYTVTANNGSCTSLASASFSNAVMLTTPAVPTITSTAPTCSANGSSTVSNYDAALTYVFNPAGPTVGAGGAISGMTVGTSYTVTAGNGSCTSVASASFSNAVMLTTPAVPTIASTAPTCIADGSSEISNYDAALTYTFNPTGPTVGAGGAISGMTVGDNYVVNASDGTCTSVNSASFSNASMLPTPLVSASANTPCVGQTLTLTGGANGLSYSWSGPNAYASTSQNPTVSSSATASMAGIYTLTVSDGTCSNSTTVNVTINALPTLDISGVDPQNPTNCGDTDGSITGIVGSGAATLSYSWNGGTSQPTEDLIGVGSGSYTLVVTDGNGCSNSEGPFTISDPTPPAQPTITLDPGAVCVGGSFTISVSSPDGAATYAWSGPGGYTNTGTSITLTNITTANSGNYTVTPTVLGCTGNTSAPINVTVNTLPNVDVLPPLVVNCDNPIITLDGSNSDQTNTTFSWSVANGGVIIGDGDTDTETTSTPGDYELVVENTITGCTNSETVSVVDNFDTPTADVSTTNGGLIDCTNTSLVLDGTGSTNAALGSTGITYTWSNTSGGTSIGSASTFTANAAGDYYLLVEETISGCTDEVMITITADANIPTAVIDVPNSLTCTITSVTLNGANSLGSPLTYEWTDATTAVVGSNATLDVTTPGQYTLEVTNTDNNCTNTVNVTVSEDVTVPTVSVVSPLVVSCNVPEVNLDGTGSDQGAEFIYTWTTADGVIIGNTNLDTAATSNAGSYNLLVTNTDNGCTANADIIVTMDTVSPIADAGTDVNFPCGVTNVALDGSASSGTGITYNWTGPTTITNGTTDSPNVNGAGQFTLTVTETNGCFDTDVVDVIPDVNAPVANAGTGIVITCNNTLPVALDGSGSDSGTDITYSWSTTGSGNIIDGTTTTPTVDQAGTYEILVTNTSNNCTATATVTVSTDTVSPVANAGITSVTICDNSTTILDGVASTGTNLTYNWTTTNGTIDSQTGAEATVSDAGDYELTVTGDNGCSDATVVTVSLATPITETTAPTIAPSDCGIDNGSITGIVVNGDPTLSYSWENATGTEIGTSADISNLGVGDYTLIVTDGNGCDATFGPYSITNPNAPIANVPTITQPDCDNATGSISVGGAFDSYELTGTNPLVASVTNTTGDFSNLNPGDYEIVVVDASCNSLPVTFTIDNTDNLDCDGDGVTNGDEIADGTDPNDPCDFIASSITLDVTTTVSCEVGVVIPDGFSPNNDNVNDLFVITNIENYPNNTFSVFNRWGNIVYEQAGYLNTWDGTSQAKVKIGGETLPTGTYFFILDLGEDLPNNQDRVIKGYIYLNR